MKKPKIVNGEPMFEHECVDCSAYAHGVWCAELLVAAKILMYGANSIVVEHRKRLERAISKVEEKL